MRQLKVQKIKRLIRDHDITALQEVHGNRYELNASLGHLSSGSKSYPQGRIVPSSSYKTFSSFHPDAATGGVATIFHARTGTLCGEWTFSEVVPGRVLRVAHTIAHRTFIHWNVHNYGMLAESLTAVISLIQQDVDNALRSPDSMQVLLQGDMNFLAPGELQHSLSLPLAADDAAAMIPPIRPLQQLWDHLLSSLTDIAPDFDTHYTAASNSSARLDRTYISTPTSTLLQAKLLPRLLDDPKRLQEQGISDHAPFSLEISGKPLVCKDSQPVPKYIVKLPRFRTALQEIWQDINTDDLSPPQRLITYKTAMREASIIARNEMFLQDPENLEGTNSTMAAIARCVWTNDTFKARILRDRAPLGAKHISLEHDFVELIDRQAFETEFESIRSAALEQRKLERSQIRRKKKSGNTGGISRMLKLWSPSGKSLVLAGIAANGTVHRTDSAKLDSLAAHWAHTFAEKPFQAEDAQAYATQHMSQFTFAEVPPPGCREIRTFLSRVRDSSPGDDGLPYSAWAASGDTGVSILHDSLLWIMSGQSLDISFNNSLSAFVPKGTRHEDATEVIRPPDETRPLALKNTDNKTLCGVLNAAIKQPLHKFSCHLQRGFIAGRNFVNNIVDLDTAIRCYDMSTPQTYPLLAFFDFGSAFPSVLHKWLFTCVETAGFPKGFQNALHVLYTLVAALGSVSGQVNQFLFWIFSGVLQGCPLSGSCFALCMDPFLREFETNLEDQESGIVRACADDVGAAVKARQSLCTLHNTFQAAAQLGGLHLTIKKCVLVVVHCHLTISVIENLRNWLAANCPAWVRFSIVDVAKYLGFFMGPKAASLQWTAAKSKWRTRAFQLAALNAPLRATAYIYNSTCLTTLSYLCQLLHMPKHVSKYENAVLCKLLHMPFNAFLLSDFFAIGSWGGAQLHSLSAAASAALMRSALVTLTTWQTGINLLRTTADSHLDAVSVFNDRFWTKRWDSTALAFNLEQAASGRSRNRTLRVDPVPAAASALLQFPEHPLRPQQAFYKAFKAETYPDTLHNTILRRLSCMFPEHALTLAGWDFSATKGALCKFKPICAHMMIKTWVNAWTTTSRFHEDNILTCILGCTEKESTQHYMTCPRVWRSLRSVRGFRASPMPQRLALNVAPADIEAVCTVYHFYHSARHMYMPQLQSLLAAGDADAFVPMTHGIMKASLNWVRTHAGLPTNFLADAALSGI